MKRDTVNYLAVGSFVLLMLVGLIALLFAITGRTGPADRYHVYYRNVAGLKPGTPVYFQGYGVGQIAEVTPEPGAGGMRYRVDLAIRSGWPVPQDSVATVAATGLLSDVSIEILEGKSGTLLPPDSEIAGREGGDLFTALNDLAGEVRTLTQSSIRPFVDQLSQTLGEGAPAIADARKLIAKLNQGADGLNEMVGPTNRHELAQLLQRMNQASGNTQQLSAELLDTRKQLDALLAQANTLLAENRPQAEQSLRELRLSLQTVSEHIDTIMQQLDGTTRNLQEFSREIRANPNRLLSGKPPKDLAETAP